MRRIVIVTMTLLLVTEAMAQARRGNNRVPRAVAYAAPPPTPVRCVPRDDEGGYSAHPSWALCD